jgi:hypothetical protein
MINWHRLIPNVVGGTTYEKNYYDLYLYIIILCTFFPLPTAKLAIRKDIFFSLHPIKAFTTNI